MRDVPNASAGSTTTTVKQVALVAGIAVACVLAAPLLAVLGLIFYTVMLLGLTGGAAWGMVSAIKGEVVDREATNAAKPQLDSV